MKSEIRCTERKITHRIKRHDTKVVVVKESHRLLRKERIQN